MSAQNRIMSAAAPPPVGPYPHARRVGELLFLSGIGPRAVDGNTIPQDFAAQCHAVFANVKAVLESAGGGLGDLVDVTVFLTDIARDFATFNRIYAEYFSAETGPCRTTVEVNRLPTPIAIELKCIAHLPPDCRRPHR
jgi:2-aminomuconate deaminase